MFINFHDVSKVLAFIPSNSLLHLVILINFNQLLLYKVTFLKGIQVILRHYVKTASLLCIVIIGKHSCAVFTVPV
jgi:hypothetical protein